jgi:HEAT repeat protein
MLRILSACVLSIAVVGLFGCSTSALPPAKTPSVLKEDLKSSDKTVRLAAATELGKMGPGAVDMSEDLLAALKDQDPQVRQAAAEALGQIGHEADHKIVEQVEAMAAIEKNAMVQSSLLEAAKAMKSDHPKHAPKQVRR